MPVFPINIQPSPRPAYFHRHFTAPVAPNPITMHPIIHALAKRREPAPITDEATATIIVQGMQVCHL